MDVEDNKIIKSGIGSNVLRIPEDVGCLRYLINHIPSSFHLQQESSDILGERLLSPELLLLMPEPGILCYV